MQYVIQQVSTQTPPRSWSTKNGASMVAYKVKLSDGQVVEYSRSAKMPAPLTGDVVDGTIVSNQYGARLQETYKKKAATAPQPAYKRDDGAIQAQWAIGQAVQIAVAKLSNGGTEMAWSDIEATADKFFAMIGRVKAPTTKRAEVAAQPTLPPTEDYVPDDIDSPIDLNDIPF